MLRLADRLLKRNLVEYRDAVMWITEVGTAVVVDESGLIKKATGS